MSNNDNNDTNTSSKINKLGFVVVENLIKIIKKYFHKKGNNFL